MEDLALLLDWLRGQLDDDERAARAATPGPWGYDPRTEFPMPDGAKLEFVHAGTTPDLRGIAATGPSNDPQSMADAGHIARHDPEHVLADVAAKRALLALGDERVIRLVASGYRDRR
jgi:hypothetical protein